MEPVVAGVGVAVEHAVAMHGPLREPEEHLGSALAGGYIGARLELGPGPTVGPLRRQHALGRQLSDDRGDAHERMALIATHELGLVRGLDAVVELVAHPRTQLVDETLHVEALQRERREQSVEHLGVVEVGPDRTVDARILDFHRDLSAVGKHRAVHLADRRRRDRHRVPVEEEATWIVAQLARARPPRRGEGAMGGTSAWRVASAACASGGRPSAMKPISWPAFMIAPFMLPSSRATSSAVRIANRCSSAARASASALAPRTFTTAKWAPRRAVSLQTRADRRTRFRRSGSASATDAATPAATSPVASEVAASFRANADAGPQPAQAEQRVASGAIESTSSPIGRPQTSHTP